MRALRRWLRLPAVPDRRALLAVPIALLLVVLAGLLIRARILTI
jgi:hypothetical protein